MTNCNQVMNKCVFRIRFVCYLLLLVEGDVGAATAAIDNSTAGQIVRQNKNISEDLHKGGLNRTLNGSEEIYGLTGQADEIAIDEDGTILIQYLVPVTLRFYGANLDDKTQIRFTSMPATRGTSCNKFHLHSVYSLKNSTTGTATLRLRPDEDMIGYYHICIRDKGKGKWLHQGQEPHQRIKVVRKLLPDTVVIALIVVLLCLSGLFSGLNLGLMALDKNDLQVIATCGTESEKRYAKKIQPVRKRGNYLLCSLLLGNVLVNSSLTILLESLMSGIVAVAGSTLSIVIFGEIVPQAICSRHGLAVGSNTIYITYLFMILTFPLSWPVSKILDKVLGDEIGNVYDRERLMEYIKVTKKYNKLEVDEMNIISGALILKKQTVGQVMTKLEDVFMLSMDSILDFATISAITSRGYSRIPVYEGDRKHIVGLLHAKDLAFVDPDDNLSLRQIVEFYKHPLNFTYEDITLDIVLEEFKKGRSHLAFVRKIYDSGEGDPYHEVSGVVTLEDVIEEILQIEIIDETDILTDNRMKKRRKEAQQRQDFSEFMKVGEGQTEAQLVSSNMALAVYQFLATAIEPFTSAHISERVLRRLMSQKIYYKIKVDHESKSIHGDDDPSLVLYTAGKPADYFILIIEGLVKINVGKEMMPFTGGGFTYFGVSALKLPQQETISKTASRQSVFVHQTDSHQEQRQSSPSGSLRRSPTSAQMNLPIKESSPAPNHFIPDFSVKVAETVVYIKITRRVYLAAVTASRIDLNKDPTIFSFDPEEDVFKREMDKAFTKSSSNLTLNVAGIAPQKKSMENLKPSLMSSNPGRKSSSCSLKSSPRNSMIMSSDEYRSSVILCDETAPIDERSSPTEQSSLM